MVWNLRTLFYHRIVLSPNTDPQHKQRGITLIEALLVLTILAGASVLILLDFRASQRRFALQNAAQQLSLDLRRAQALTLQAREEGGMVPPGYGIEIKEDDPTSYILFKDSDNRGTYSGLGELIEEIKLPESVFFLRDPVFESPAYLYVHHVPPPPPPPTFESCFPGGPKTAKVNITFVPPDPQVDIRRNPSPDPSCFKACIFLRTQNALDRIVGVTKTGLVNVYSGANALTKCIDDL